MAGPAAILRGLLLALAAMLLAPGHALADDSGPCPRPEAGSVVAPPPEMKAEHGVLNVHFNYFTAVDD